MTTILLLDIGNTRIKTARWDGRQLRAGRTMPHDGDPAAALAAARLPRAHSVWVASVTGAAHEARIAQVLSARYGIDPQFAHSSARALGLVSAYRDPARLGIDRWLALLGARTHTRGAVCVVDAGTALTVDCADARGHHLGGFIAAGLMTSQKAVLGATRFAARPPAARYTAGLGRDTDACVRQGAYLSCLGAIDRGSRAAGPRARKFITGGDARLLLPQLGAGWEHRPLLVFEGLLALARAAL